MSTFLLVHGAWHGAWVWERLTPLLRERGHGVVAPDLPGHGDDRTSWWRVTLGAYARRVNEAALSVAEPPIAVGHSMGGCAITEAAARKPGRLGGLVYLCAFVPQPGESLMALARRDREARTGGALRRGFGRMSVAPERAAEIFYNTCAPQDAAAASARLRPQPMLPFFQRASSPRGDLPPRAYIECSEDRAIAPSLQRSMRERAGIERVATLATDHSPFYSAPDELAARLDHIARTLAAPLA